MITIRTDNGTMVCRLAGQAEREVLYEIASGQIPATQLSATTQKRYRLNIPEGRGVEVKNRDFHIQLFLWNNFTVIVE